MESLKPELESTTTTTTTLTRDSDETNNSSSNSIGEVVMMVQQKQKERGEVVNGYIVYARRKRSRHTVENEEESKKLRTCGEGAEVVGIKAEESDGGGVFGDGGSGEVVEEVPVRNDVVLWRLRRNRKPTWKTEVAEGEGEEKALVLKTKSEKVVVVNRRPMNVKELFDTGLLDGVPVVYMGCKKVRHFYFHFISYPSIFIFSFF